MDNRITVVITTYKREIKIVKRALSSALSQSLPPFEVILVDDNREDQASQELSSSLKELVSSLKTEYPGTDLLHVRTLDGRHGSQAARNTGIKLARCPYIAFLDDDDEWLSQKLERQMELLLSRPDAGMCFCRGLRVDMAYDPPYVNDFQGEGFRSEVTYRELLRGDCIGTTSQALIRRDVFDRVGLFDEALPARQDYEMWIRISRVFPIVGVDEQLFRYYKNSGGEQITRNWDNCIRGHGLIYKKYKKDIDSDRAARFNIIFYMAHYHMKKGDRGRMVLYYARAFFVSPGEFFKKGQLKLQSMKKDRELRRSSV